MPGGKWCLCPNTQTALWTSRQSWHERLAGCGSQVHFQWRCSNCKTKRSAYVDSLWRKTFLMAGGTPSCELGCVGGPVHLGRTCGRTIGPFDVALKLAESEAEPTIRVALASGPDFVRVASAHRTHAVLLELPVFEKTSVGPTSASFSVGVCILPTCIPNSTLAATYRTVGFIEGVAVSCGRLPHVFSIKKEKARVVDAVKFRGAPLGPFLGLSGDVWRQIWGSPCAMSRYSHIIYGHTAKGTAPKIEPTNGSVHQPTLSAPASLVPPPKPIMWQGSYRCVYCGTLHETKEAFSRQCAPELLE